MKANEIQAIVARGVTVWARFAEASVGDTYGDVEIAEDVVITLGCHMVQPDDMGDGEAMVEVDGADLLEQLALIVESEGDIELYAHMMLPDMLVVGGE